MRERMTREELLQWRNAASFPIARRLAAEALILRVEQQDTQERLDDALARIAALEAALQRVLGDVHPGCTCGEPGCPGAALATARAALAATAPGGE